jgi:hypothetical protein
MEPDDFCRGGWGREMSRKAGAEEEIRRKRRRRRRTTTTTTTGAAAPAATATTTSDVELSEACSGGGEAVWSRVKSVIR